MTKSHIPVNPEILRWAREGLNLSRVEVARKMDKTKEDIAAWETGEYTPTYVQLERLASEIYKRPIALFFFPKPPDEEQIEEIFRTLPNQELERIPARIRLLIRYARVLQLNLEELFQDEVEPNPGILDDLHFSGKDNIEDLANQVRSYLNIDLVTQKGWNDVRTAFQRWRSSLETCGIFIFKESFKEPGGSESPYSGFCLYDREFPIIFINNNDAYTRQIFTMFHELAHLLMESSDIENRMGRSENFVTSENQSVEVLCNKFAGEFLVPSRDFKIRIDHDYSETNIDKLIEDMAHIYHVSRETILRKLVDYEILNPTVYNQYVKECSNQTTAQQSGGGNYYLTKIAYLGDRYLSTVFRNYSQSRISIEQVANYLDMKVKNVTTLEDKFLELRFSR